MLNFIDKLAAAARKNNSLLCVGLDPDRERMPAGLDTFRFNKAIIDATADLACAYKLNLAFYEAMGDEGTDALKRTIKHVPQDIPVIGDAKRGDIGNTANAYARAIFEIFGFDATTVSPYLGFDSIEPFIKHINKGVFILCRTSNPGAADFQSLTVNLGSSSMQLYEIVAERAAVWNTHGNIGLVVGATYPEELRLIREQHPDMPLLIPGIGAQGGDLELAVQYGVNAKGEMAIINSSRQILYASKEADFAEAARRVALSLRDEMNSYRTKV